MLGGAKYFSTLDLEAGFHQIRMAKEDRWKTAFSSVLGMFQYKVMPFGLKGAPATFQASINAYLQALLGHGVIAYLDVLIDSADLPIHAVLLRKVLSIFLTNQFYPKVRKCQFARQELTYLGYTISAEGIKPAADKIVASRVWPEAGMTPVQQKHSIYGQELLALVTPLDKWSHLLRIAKVTAFTDHQALTHLRKLQTSKPLGGRTDRWLDSLTEFPDLTITYPQGVRNTVPDALSRLACHCSSQPPPLPSPSPPPLSGSSAPPLLAPPHPDRAHHTRRTQVDYRQLAGIGSRTPRTRPTRYIQSDEREWECLLPALELAYNATSHSSTELSPFDVTIRENPLTAADLDVVGVFSPTLTPPMAKLFRQLCGRAQSHILKAKCQQKQYADTRRREVEYALGDKVVPDRPRAPELEAQEWGPFVITERIGSVAYRLALPPLTNTYQDVFNVSQVVPDRPRAPELEAQEAVVGLPPTRDVPGNPTDQYEVDCIMDQRGSGDEAHYLVKWRGAPEDRATWEPASHLRGYPALLRA
ncbi:hypothetical protein EPH_0005470 [Eimeria praecox]|uniref:Chromo domain-containing protein n=1 Tax=Eimeria praecox TaxID=51316 RepID=U6GA52_9EIME|nr:hypothetical protein EPH_0005470 [Eimeria praecox]